MIEYSLEITESAKNDLKEIYNYIANSLMEPTTAEKQLERIEEGILSLKHMPLRIAMEHNESLKQRNLRKLIVDNYLIFFLVNEETYSVIIVRVIYGRRDWVALL